MFLKQYNYKPRSTSQSSGSDGSDKSAQQSPSSPTTLNDPSISAAVQSRRRSSAADRFAGLQNYKRSSLDQGTSDRRAAYAEQSAAGSGVLGGMWQNFTKGTSK